ncbi:MAG: DUF2085 domain-containing protein [Ignavibacteria bacterium]
MNIKIKFGVLILVIIWYTGLIAEFLLPEQSPVRLLALLLKITYGNVCHQNPMKTITIGANRLLVCSRCFGIYSGALLSSAVALCIKRSVRIKTAMLFICALPMITDIALYTTGIYYYSKIIAFLTGLLLGSVGFFYILDAFVKFVFDYKMRKVKI